MKPLLSLLLSFSIVSSPLYAQDEPGEETQAQSEVQEKPDTTVDEKTDTTEAKPAESNEMQTPEPENKKDKTRNDEVGAPPKGIAKLIPGIVTASVGTGFGLLLVALSRVNCSDLTKDRDKNDDSANKSRDDDIKDCEKLKPTYRKLGVGSIVVGLGVGLPLIYFGIEERKIYNEWKSQQPAEPEASNLRGSYGHADLVLLENRQQEFVPGLGFTLNF